MIALCTRCARQGDTAEGPFCGFCGSPLATSPENTPRALVLRVVAFWAALWSRAATLDMNGHPFTLEAQRRHERRAAEHAQSARLRARIVLGPLAASFAFLVLGCSEVRVIVDAGGDVTAAPSCAPFVNVIGEAVPRCDWQAWRCADVVPSSAVLDACRARVVELEERDEASCEAVRVIVERCR